MASTPAPGFPSAPGPALALRDWLLGAARFIDDADVAVMGLAQRLLAAGVPVARLGTAIPTLHASRRGLGRIWTVEAGVQVLDYAWGAEATYRASPYFRAHETDAWVRFSPAEIGDTAFNVVRELREAGYTDYICIPVSFVDGLKGGFTFATRHARGFDDNALAVLRLIEPALGIVMDLKRAWLLVNETLRMYVGNEPHARILSGQVQRGETIPIHAAILFADMRGFTRLSATIDAAATVALLNRYFDCVVPHVEAAGGEVLKYLGDGVLAVFANAEPAEACAAALRTAEAILAAVDETPEFDAKVALHCGEVAFGNIGSGARLDYTVVGQDVNIASRLADLASEAGERLLTSTTFAALLPASNLAPLGNFTLRGVTDPVTVMRRSTESGDARESEARGRRLSAQAE